MSDKEIIIRLMLAVVIGGIIGFEREAHRRAAGLRTHILVCLSATLITLTSLYIADKYSGVYQHSDPSRIAAGIVMGIGFLGAGTIMRSKTSVFGLTTAASLWSVAAIGLALGCGFYKAALIASVAIIVALALLGKIAKRFLSKKQGVEEEEDI